MTQRTRDEWEREAINCRRGETSPAYSDAVLDVLMLYAQVDRLKVENAVLKVEYDKLDQAWLNAEGEIETLKAKVAERDWRPIESAPKDGTRILCMGGGCQPAIFQWDGPSDGAIYAATPSHFNWCDDSGSHCPDDALTHWMPLPALTKDPNQ